MKLWGGRRGSKLASDRGKAAPALPPGARRPTRDEQREMIAALDRMLLDEQTLRANGHNPTIPALYRRDIVECMDATVEGRLVDPDLMFHCLDLLDQAHRMAQVADQDIHRFSAERQRLMALVQVDAA